MASTSAGADYRRGDQVRFIKRRHGLSEFGMVNAVGICDSGRSCPNGDECITVATHTTTGGVMTVNVTADQIELAGRIEGSC